MPEAVDLPVILDWRLAEGRGWARFNEIHLEESTLPPRWIKPLQGLEDPRPERETEGDVNRRVIDWWSLASSKEGDMLVVTHRWPIALWISTFRDVDYAPGNCEFVTFTGWDSADDDVASIGRSSIDADDLSDASDT